MQESFVQFADTVTVTAATVLTLESTTGSLVPAGSLTLVAAAGVVLHDDMTAAASNKPLVIDADYESEGDGTLTVQTGKTVTSNKSDVTITAWDVTFDGGISAGTASIVIHGAEATQTIGLGTTPTNMAIEDAELGRMTAAGTAARAGPRPPARGVGEARFDQWVRRPS